MIQPRPFIVGLPYGEPVQLQFPPDLPTHKEDEFAGYACLVATSDLMLGDRPPGHPCPMLAPGAYMVYLAWNLPDAEAFERVIERVDHAYGPFSDATIHWLQARAQLRDFPMATICGNGCESRGLDS